MKLRMKRFLSLLLVCGMLAAGLSLTAFATGGTGDATLASLEVSPGTLSPEFSPSTYEYRVEVSAECDKLLVNAQTTDSGAKMVIAGNSGLKMGENPVIISVTAADGVTTAKYTIRVVRGASESQTAAQTAGNQIPSSPLIVGTTAANAPSETGSTQSTEAETQSGEEGTQSGEAGTQDGTEAQNSGASPAGTVVLGGRSYTIETPAEELVPSGFTPADITIGGQTVSGWMFPSSYDADGFYLIYGTNQEGKTSFFIYDQSEGTVISAPSGLVTMGQENQISQSKLQTAQDSYQKSMRIRMMIIIGLAVLCFILLIALTASMTRKRHDQEGGHDEYDEYDDGPSGDEEDEPFDDEDYEDESYDGEAYGEAYEDDDYYDLDGEDEEAEAHMWASTEDHAAEYEEEPVIPEEEPEYEDDDLKPVAAEPEYEDDDLEPAAAEPEYEDDDLEPVAAEPEYEEDDLDSDFDLLEALLSDSVPGGRADGGEKPINPVRQLAAEKPYNPVRESGAAKSAGLSEQPVKERAASRSEQPVKEKAASRSGQPAKEKQVRPTRQSAVSDEVLDLDDDDDFEILDL